jgi:hypothetical protein
MSSNQNMPPPSYEKGEYYQQMNIPLPRGKMTYQIARSAWATKEKEDYDKFCRSYDKCYHVLDSVAYKLSRYLERKAETPFVHPKYLKAWQTFSYHARHPVVTAVNTENNWMWEKINRISPFQAVHDKLLNNGYWLKSTLFADKDGQYYFEISVGFYIQHSDLQQDETIHQNQVEGSENDEDGSENDEEDEEGEEGEEEEDEEEGEEDEEK